MITECKWRCQECGFSAKVTKTTPKVVCPMGHVDTAPANNMKNCGEKKIVRKSKIGDRLEKKFSKYAKAKKGCQCEQIKNILNTKTPEQVIQNLNHWAVVVQRSARDWKEEKGGVWTVIPTPPLTVFRRFLYAAAMEEMEEKTKTTKE